MNTKSTQTPESLVSPHGSAAHLADDVTVGQVVRWINREHLQAAKETPPNGDYMRAMQRCAEGVESALWSYQMANPKSALISCRWSEDEDGNWDTACGECFVFEVGGPTENRAKWCPYCGRRIEPVGFFQQNTPGQATAKPLSAPVCSPRSNHQKTPE